MAVRNILMIGNNGLREISKPADFNIDSIADYVADLRDTLKNFQSVKKIGRAIAAPQIGIFKRIVYMEAGDIRYVLINPEIIGKSDEMFEVWDSCFSADVSFFGKTLRNKSITIRYYDENGQMLTDTFNDDLSELFQHEIDHLDGILFTDRIINNQIIMRSEWEKL